MKMPLKNKDGRKGGITVFLCLILVSVIVTGGILVDAARLALARSVLDRAAESALRSVMAGYDTNLSGQYGLFALETSDRKRLEEGIRRYIRLNTGSEMFIGTGSSPGLLMDEDSITIRCGDSITDISVFKSQILDFMEIRGVLHASENIIDMLSGNSFTAGLSFMKKEKLLRENRKKLIDEIESINCAVNEAEKEMPNISGSDGFRRIEAIFENIFKSADVLGSVTQEYEEAYNESEIERTDGFEFGGVAEKAAELAEAASCNVLHAAEAASEAERYEALLNEEFQALERNRHKESELRAERCLETNDEIKSKIDQKLDGLKKSAEQTDERISALNAGISELINEVPFSSFDLILYEEAENTESGYSPDEEPKNSWYGLVSIFTGSQGDFFDNIDPSWLNTDEYDENEIGSGPDIETDLDQGSTPVPGESIAEQQCEFGINILEKIMEAGRAAADKVMITEYLTANYSSFTSPSSVSAGSYLRKGEIEYLIWGGLSQSGNILKCAGCVWSLRFAISLIDYFVRSLNPHPVYRLIYAAAKAAVKACSDTVSLYLGHKVPLIPSAGLMNNDYADYLRIFLLMTMASDEKKILERALQLIRINRMKAGCNSQLSCFATKFEISVRAEVRLMFTGLLLPPGIRSRKKDGFYCSINSKTEMSYMDDTCR